eukprot:2001311-Prymnesium_polylepis.1
MFARPPSQNVGDECIVLSWYSVRQESDCALPRGAAAGLTLRWIENPVRKHRIRHVLGLTTPTSPPRGDRRAVCARGANTGIVLKRFGTSLSLFGRSPWRESAKLAACPL